MKKMTVLTTLIVLVISLVSCTKKKNLDEKVLNIAISAKVKGMDPIYSNDVYSSSEVSRVYEGLLEYNYVKRPYELRENLAESMPEVSADGLTYTFKIRKGVLFHDDKAFPQGKGRELVANDFVYSIKRLADPKLQGLGWWLLDGKVKGLNEWRDKYKDAPKVNYDEEVEGLKAVDAHTLQFKLQKPFPQFLYSLAMSFTYVVAKEVVDTYGKEFLNHPVGTGPFLLKEFNQSNKIEYTVNPNFREKTFPCGAAESFKARVEKYCGKKVPFVKKVVVNVLIEDQPRWLNFQKGKVDYISVPKDNFESAIPDAKNLAPEYKSKGISLLIEPSLDVTYTGFNHDLKLLQNKKLRQAMMLAYDINKANKLFFNNTALPAQSMVPPGVSGHIDGFVSPYRFQNESSIEKAKKLLAEAGYPEGKGLEEIILDVPSSTVARQQAEFFKKSMAAIGVNIKVNQNTWPEFQKKITKRQIQLYGIGWSADYPDAENFLQLLYGPNKSPGANGSGFDKPEFNKLYATASIMQDSPVRTALYEKMYRMAAEDVPVIFGVHRQSYVIKHSWIPNYIVTDFDQGNAQYLDVDIETKKKMIEKL